MESSDVQQAFLPFEFVAEMSTQDLKVLIVPQPEGSCVGFRNASAGVISAVNLKTRIVVCHCPSLALVLAW